MAWKGANMIECYRDFWCPMPQAIVLRYVFFAPLWIVEGSGVCVAIPVGHVRCHLKACNQQKHCARVFSEYYNFPYQCTSIPYSSIHSLAYHWCYMIIGADSVLCVCVCICGRSSFQTDASFFKLFIYFFIGTLELECSKGKSIRLQTWAGLEHSRRLRLPYLKVAGTMQVVRLSALRTSRLYPPGNIRGTHFC